MTTNGNHMSLYIAVAALLAVVVLLNVIRPYVRKKKFMREMQKEDDQETKQQQLKTSEMLENINQPCDSVSINTHPEKTSLFSDDQQALKFSAAVNDTKQEKIVGGKVNSTERQAVDVVMPVKKKPQETTGHNDLIMVSIHAPRGCSFGDYNFLQTLGAMGLAFGDHQIFHYDVKTEHGEKRLFSAAKLNKPGTFDIDNIESIDCQGLLLFVNLKQCARIQLAVDCMLDIAQQLSEELEGALFEGYNTPWTKTTAARIIKIAEAYPRAKTQANHLEPAMAEAVY